MSTRATRTPSTPGILRQEISLTQPGAEPGVDAPDQPSFWERLYAISPEDWSKFFVYLYRGRTGPNLAKITHPFDPDWVRQRYGGGEYRAMLNDEKYKMVATHIFAIEGPPKIAPSEAPTSAAPAAAGGMDYFQAEVLKTIQESNRQTQDLLREVIRDRHANPTAPAAAAAIDPNIAVKGVVEMFTQMIPKQKDPLELLVQLKDLIQPRQQDDLLTILGKAKELGLLAAGANVGGGNLIEQLAMVTEVASKLGLSAGNGKGIGELLLEHGPNIVKEVGGLMDKYRDAEKARFQTVQAVATLQRNPAAAAPAAPGQAPQHSAAPAPPSPPAPAAPGLEVEPIGTPAAAQQPAVALDQIDMLKQKIVEAIAKGSTGADIVSFLDIMDERLASSFVGVPVKQLAEFFAADPILTQATKFPRFEACLEEIVEVLNEDEGGTGLPN